MAAPFPFWPLHCARPARVRNPRCALSENFSALRVRSLRSPGVGHFVHGAGLPADQQQASRLERARRGRERSKHGHSRPPRTHPRPHPCRWILYRPGGPGRIRCGPRKGAASPLLPAEPRVVKSSCTFLNSRRAVPLLYFVAVLLTAVLVDFFVPKPARHAAG